MKKEIAEEWIAELRSGRWTQTTKRLKTVEGHCCLGVLCELAIKHGVPTDAYKSPTDPFWEFDGESEVLPSQVENWAGLRTTGGYIRPGGSTCLSALNDDGSTFDEIADKIEESINTL